MTEEDKKRYFKILKEGNEKRYYIKIMLLGKQGVGKSTLLKNLLQEPIDSVTPTDGIDIAQRCKVNIENGEWIFREGETPDERIGRVLRKPDGTVNFIQSLPGLVPNTRTKSISVYDLQTTKSETPVITDDIVRVKPDQTSQNRQSVSAPQEHSVHAITTEEVSEGINNCVNDQNETSGEYEKKEYNMHNKDRRNQEHSDMPSIVEEKNITEGRIVEPNTREAWIDLDKGQTFRLPLAIEMKINFGQGQKMPPAEQP
ncbi:uncharacterized protein LOC143058085 [Mytilus galloprovincialis]|uniref:uncharacterized protein LOC143058085 n=1 Tax=Mytilus galloprovincialis TaxID=29158 RepID=UPI003F7BECF5